jgi:hypothetical protein
MQKLGYVSLRYIFALRKQFSTENRKLVFPLVPKLGLGNKRVSEKNRNYKH